MFRSRFLWKLVLVCAGLNVVAAIALGVILSAWLAADGGDSSATRRWLWAVLAAESVTVLLLAYWLVGRIVRPITALSAAAEAIAAGDYEHRLYVPNRDELGNLAATLNHISQSLGSRMAQLSQTADRQSTALGGMIEGVIAVDARLRVVLANAAAGRLFGFRPAAVENRSLLEVVRNHALHAAVTSALAGSEPQQLQTNRAGAQPLHLNIHIQPLPGEPCPGVVLVIHDITELRRLESMRRDFVANVSHELKTPLSSIKAYTETLRNGTKVDPETAQHFLGRIEEQADRLHNLILDMLMLARIESDHQVFEITAVDMAEVVSTCIDAQRPAATAKCITINVEAPSTSLDEPCRVRADREGLREILDNLVDNAIKYTPEGGKITIAWQRKRNEADAENSPPPDQLLASSPPPPASFCPSPIPASESSPPTRPASSSDSTASTKPAPANWAALASGSRSLNTSCKPSEAASQ
jgi:two-component system, OmpR family, phosphate regulon sensor histidine kinase PhoR